MVETTIKRVTNQIKKNKLEFILLVGILLLAATFRFYRISEYMTFLGDEGRDAIIVKRAIINMDFPLIGPPTSIGNIYLGPLYYYMMMVPFAITGFNPVSAAAMIGIIGVLTVWLIYYFAKKWFGSVAGLTASFLFAISPVTIVYSRSSWNPNPTPFFSLLALLGIFKAKESRNWMWYIFTGVSLAFVVQMHYLALILLPVFALLWFLELFNKKKNEYTFFWCGSFYSVISFLLLMSPLFIFDMRHNFVNFRAMQVFFSQRETTVNINPLNTITRVWPVFQEKLLLRYLTGENILLSYLVVGIITIVCVNAGIILLKNKRINWEILAIFIWFIGGLIGLSLYKQNIYDHYLGFIAPIPYFFLAAFIKLIPKKFSIITAIFLVIILGLVNLQKNPLFYPPNKQLQRTQKVAKRIIEQADNQPLNFALIAEHNYDAAYQYYLDLYGHKAKEVPFDITDQLFVVCEDKICQPTTSPKYEIAAFGWSKIINEEAIDGIKLFKLTHNNQ